MNRQSNVATDIIVYSSIVAGIFLMTATANGSNLMKSTLGGWGGVIQAATGQRVTA